MSKRNKLWWQVKFIQYWYLFALIIFIVFLYILLVGAIVF